MKIPHPSREARNFACTMLVVWNTRKLSIITLSFPSWGLTHPLSIWDSVFFTADTPSLNNACWGPVNHYLVISQLRFDTPPVHLRLRLFHSWHALSEQCMLWSCQHLLLHTLSLQHRIKRVFHSVIIMTQKVQPAGRAVISWPSFSPI